MRPPKVEVFTLLHVFHRNPSRFQADFFLAVSPLNFAVLVLASLSGIHVESEQNPQFALTSPHGFQVSALGL
jgi:hypothetical protein